MSLLNTLPAPHRSVLLLHFIEGFSIEEIAGDHRGANRHRQVAHALRKKGVAGAYRGEIMKTPREIILGRHQEAVPALDSVRERAVAAITPARKSDPRIPANFVEFLVSLRWHVAAMSALWLLGTMLGAEPHPHTRGGMVAARAVPSLPMDGILALREYSEELDEADNPPPRHQPPPIPHACTDPRREWECCETA